GPAVEGRVAGLRRRDWAVSHGGPPAAGHQQVEPDRASAVRLHHPELARQAPAPPPGVRPFYRPPPPPPRPPRPVPPRPQRLRERRQGVRCRDGQPQSSARRVSRRLERHHPAPTAPRLTRYFGLRP